MEIAGTRRGRARLERRFRTFVVGSDQVWRAAYADIPAQFLDVLEPIHGGSASSDLVRGILRRR